MLRYQVISQIICQQYNICLTPLHLFQQQQQRISFYYIKILVPAFKIKYPSDWRVESVSNSTVVSMFFPQESTASNASNASNVTVDISIENLSASITPDEYRIQIKSF